MFSCVPGLTNFDSLISRFYDWLLNDSVESESTRLRKRRILSFYSVRQKPKTEMYFIVEIMTTLGLITVFFFWLNVFNL